MFLWTFTINSLGIFLLISTVIGLMYREKSFQYYALYLLFSILYILTKSPFESVLIQQYAQSHLFILDHLLLITINIFYLKFFISFLHYKTLLIRSFQWVNEISTIVLLLSLLLFGISAVIKHPGMFEDYFLFVFYPVLILGVGFTILKTLFIKGKLKFFILTGFFGFMIMSAIALILSYDLNFYEPNFRPLDSYYLGVIFENVCFACGLAYKIKLLNQQKIDAQHRIISHQNRETQNQKRLQQKIEEKLASREKELHKLHSKAEKEKLQRVSVLFREKMMQLQLEALRNQMDPHFVFNALNSIKAYLVVNDRKNAIHFLNKFSKLIRKALESLREDQISLKDELEIIDLYVSVENLRFESTIDFTMEIDPDVDTHALHIPPLFIQPFVENALIHGLLPSDNERKLSLKVYQRAATTYIDIQDNGIGRKNKGDMPQSHTRKSLGLKIIQERLNFYNLRHRTTLSYHIQDLLHTEQASGTRVVISITKKSKEASRPLIT